MGLFRFIKIFVTQAKDILARPLGHQIHSHIKLIKLSDYIELLLFST